MITRFAPSPTGYIHIGNVRTALVCWLYARKESGKFILRIDDTDVDRSDDKYTEGIKRDLEWLSINWDTCFNQRSRLERYDEIFESLLARGVIYPCYETKEELELKRSMMLKSGLPPIYDRSALRMTELERKAYSGRKPYFRLKVDQDKEISWQDEIRGRLVFQAKNISDPIIKRTDGSYTYMFPSVVDDWDFAITHIIRGEDHVSNTALQICIMELLEAEVPTFAHLSLLHVGESKVSKRFGGAEISKFRDIGIEPMAINSYLARVGTSAQIEPYVDIAEMVEEFDIRCFNQAPVRCSVDDISKLNVKILQKMSFEQVGEKLIAQGINCSEELWYAVRENIEILADVKQWVEICGATGRDNLISSEIDMEFLGLARALFPEGETGCDTWKIWLQKIKEKTDRSTQYILLSLRLALTGVPRGPGFPKLLPLIGREEILRRLTPGRADTG